ncbi:MAG: DUF4412 domain-containing protein [Holophagales bacterium]|nr:DUF4412 domain-containing protein [Holophagales bacterium]
MNRYFLAALAIASMAGQLIAGDLKITFKNEVKFMLMTQKSEEICYYSTRYILKTNEKEKTDRLIDYKDLISYEINHNTKTIYIYTLDDQLKMNEIMKNKVDTANPEKKRRVIATFGFGDNDTVKAQQVGTETIAGRACAKWEITAGKKKLYAASAAPALEMPIPKADIEKNMFGDPMMLIFALSGASSKLETEFAKIKGFPLKTELQMAQGLITVRIRQEATKIEEGPIPASIFDLPKGYKIEDAGKEMLEKLMKDMKNPDKETKKK